MAVFIGREDLKASSEVFCELSRPQDKSFSPAGQDAVKISVDVTATASNSEINLKIIKFK